MWMAKCREFKPSSHVWLSSQKVENELITRCKLTHEWWKFWFCSDYAELHAQCVMKCRLLTHYFTVEVDWLRLLKKERARKCWKVSITVVSSRCSSFKLSSCKVCSHLFMVKLYMFTNRAYETVNGQYRSIYRVHPFGGRMVVDVAAVQTVQQISRHSGSGMNLWMRHAKLLP